MIRPFIVGDAEAYRTLRMEMILGYPDAFNVDVDKYISMTASDWYDDVQKFVNANDRRRFLATSGNQLAGMVGCMVVHDKLPETTLEIGNLYVRQQYTGIGLGRSLIDECFKFSKLLEVEQTGLWVSHSNNVVSDWYERLGYVPRIIEDTETYMTRLIY